MINICMFMAIYSMENTCCQSVEILTDNNIVISVKLNGGCPGQANLIKRICNGKKIGDIIYLLEGIHCGSKNTSCADQVAKILKREVHKKKA